MFFFLWLLGGSSLNMLRKDEANFLKALEVGHIPSQAI